MASKVNSAQLSSQAGIAAVIASGLAPGALLQAVQGAAVGTKFSAAKSSLDKRRRWLAFACDPRGEIHVDEGARNALVLKQKSLLPAGVRRINQRWAAGDVVGLLCNGAEFARGLCNYGSHELSKIMGKKTSEIESALGRPGPDEVVHRDKLALIG
jgi:glutamate 5-kinase